jgi:hypothetical protein
VGGSEHPDGGDHLPCYVIYGVSAVLLGFQILVVCTPTRKASGDAIPNELGVSGVSHHSIERLYLKSEVIMSKPATAVSLFVFLVALAGPSYAQRGGPGGYASGQGHGSGVTWGMRPRDGEHRMMSRELLEGPPSPAILHDSIGLAVDQLQHYSQEYSNYIAQTRPTRDSLRTEMQQMRAAFQSGDRSGATARRGSVGSQAADLSRRDKEFEKVLKQDLSKDQQKRYDKWKESQKQAERQQHRGGHDEAPAGNL